MIHTSPTETSPFEILEELEEAGADLSRVAFAHLGRTVYDNDNLLRLADKGCFLEYDLFGTECSHYQVSWYSTPLTLANLNFINLNATFYEIHCVAVLWHEVSFMELIHDFLNLLLHQMLLII